MDIRIPCMLQKHAILRINPLEHLISKYLHTYVLYCYFNILNDMHTVNFSEHPARIHFSCSMNPLSPCVIFSPYNCLCGVINTYVRESPGARTQEGIDPTKPCSAFERAFLPCSQARQLNGAKQNTTPRKNFPAVASFSSGLNVI